MKKVSALVVKRSFVTADLVREPRRGERYLGRLSSAEFEKRFLLAKRKAAKMSVQQMDSYVASRRNRLKIYDATDWYVADMKISDVGVWKGAGGLPHSWTAGSLAETAQKVKVAIAQDSPELKKRARRTIPNILASAVARVQKEPLLYPIVFQHGTGTNGRRGMALKLKGDIDDGCMRSIALAISGKKKLKVYFGVPKRKLL